MDILIPVTASKVGPTAADPARDAKAKVYYLKASDLLKLEADTVRNASVLTVKDKTTKKVTLIETPNEFQAALAMAQGATAGLYVAMAYQVITPTASATAADQPVLSKYLNEVSTYLAASKVRLPDPFTRRLAVVVNTTTGSITVNGRGTTSPINGSTAGYTIPGLSRKHFSAPTAATAGTTAGWQVATDSL